MIRRRVKRSAQLHPPSSPQSCANWNHVPPYPSGDHDESPALLLSDTILQAGSPVPPRSIFPDLEWPFSLIPQPISPYADLLSDADLRTRRRKICMLSFSLFPLTFLIVWIFSFEAFNHPVTFSELLSVTPSP